MMSSLLCMEYRLGIDARHVVPFVGGNVTGTSGIYLGYTGRAGSAWDALNTLVTKPLTFGKALWKADLLNGGAPHIGPKAYYPMGSFQTDPTLPYKDDYGPTPFAC